MKPRSQGTSAYPVSQALLQVARTHRAYATALLRELDLFPGQELLLLDLAEHGPLSQSALVRCRCLDHSTVAKSLARMASAGLITRKTSSEDRRATIVSLTRKGEAVHDKIQAAWTALERATVAGLSSEQRKQLVRLMASVEKHIAAVARD